MQDHPPSIITRSAILPPWGWTRRQLIARSSLWFSVFPRTFKPELIDLCRMLARSRAPYETVSKVSFGNRWPLSESAPLRRATSDRAPRPAAESYTSRGSARRMRISVDEVLRWAYLLVGMQLGVPLSPSTLLLDISSHNSLRAWPHPCRSPAQPETAFHTDSGPDALVPDLVGTLCLQPAVQGGEYQVSSALRAREVMWNRCRHLLEELYVPWLRAGGAGEPNARRTQLRRPVFAHRRGMVGLHFDYARPGIEAGHRRAEQPLRPVQQLALDYLDEALQRSGRLRSIPDETRRHDVREQPPGGPQPPPVRRRPGRRPGAGWCACGCRAPSSRPPCRSADRLRRSSREPSREPARSGSSCPGPALPCPVETALGRNAYG